METINVPLPEMLKSGGFNNAADYIQAVLAAEQKRKTRAKVEAMMDEAVASGEPTEWTEQDLASIKEEIRARHAKRQGNLH